MSRLAEAVARFEGMFTAIERRLGTIEHKMVSSDVLDQIVTRLLDRIAADTIKPGCKTMFGDFERRLRDVETKLVGVAVKVSIVSAAIAFLVTLTKDFIFK